MACLASLLSGAGGPIRPPARTRWLAGIARCNPHRPGARVLAVFMTGLAPGAWLG